MWDAYQSVAMPFFGVDAEIHKENFPMKKLTLSFWLALAAAGIFILQAASASSTQTPRFDDPIPTCPPYCSERAPLAH